MRKLLYIILAVGFLVSCKKAIEDKKRDIVLDAMTDGQWVVYSFKEGDLDLTGDFSPYTFQFYRDGKVSGFSSNAEEKGTWAGDPDAMTITSSFPGSGDPVRKLNAVWKITNNSWDYVMAETTISGVVRLLHLKKK